MEIKDSGARREFETGAVRDIDEEKGRCDLLPLKIIGDISADAILLDIGEFVESGDAQYLKAALAVFSNGRYDCLWSQWLDVSIHYKDGCRKYGERNWEKGIPLHCYIDSGVRHYLKYLRGDDDEPHDRAFVWNMLGALWTLKNKPELNDMPFKAKGDDVDQVSFRDV